MHVGPTRQVEMVMTLAPSSWMGMVYKPSGASGVGDARGSGWFRNQAFLSEWLWMNFGERGSDFVGDLVWGRLLNFREKKIVVAMLLEML
jgi:hypothetical protein